MQLKAYAKINWDLHVVGKRPDGYHELDTVMVTISLHDVLTLEPAPEISLTCSDATLPTDDRNLVVKAAKALAAASGYRGGARLHLDKHVPAGGGMGGGSSDAATALQGLNALWGLRWDIQRLHAIAAQLGSDVAFFLHGGWRRCLGRGEIVEPITGSERWPALRVLLILPPLHVPTPAVYGRLALPVWDGKSGVRPLTAVAEGLQFSQHKLQGRDGLVRLGLFNGLADSARQVEPRLEELQKVLQQRCAGRWLMSGSGAAHFVVLAGSEDERGLKERLLAELGPGVRVLNAATLAP